MYNIVFKNISGDRDIIVEFKSPVLFNTSDDFILEDKDGNEANNRRCTIHRITGKIITKDSILKYIYQVQLY